MGCLTRLCIYIAVMCLVGWLFCDIDPEKTYSWYYGIWHGIFFISNLIRSWFGDALYKANSYTSAYNVWWWITTMMHVSVLFLAEEKKGIRCFWYICKKLKSIVNAPPLLIT
jgi:hypothetical protein